MSRSLCCSTSATFYCWRLNKEVLKYRSGLHLGSLHFRPHGACKSEKVWSCSAQTSRTEVCTRWMSADFFPAPFVVRLRRWVWSLVCRYGGEWTGQDYSVFVLWLHGFPLQHQHMYTRSTLQSVPGLCASPGSLRTGDIKSFTGLYIVEYVIQIKFLLLLLLHVCRAL